VQRLTPNDLRGLYRELGKKLAPSSVRLVHAVISGALAQAVRDGVLVANPCARAKPPKRGTDEAVGDVWTEDELRKFLDAVRDDRLYV
jgi:integrase